MLKDVHSLPLVFSKEWVTVRKCYAKRQSDPKDVFVYVWEVEEGVGIMFFTLWIVHMFVSFYSIPKIIQYSTPVLTLRRRGWGSWKIALVWRLS